MVPSVNLQSCGYGGQIPEIYPCSQQYGLYVHPFVFRMGNPWLVLKARPPAYTVVHGLGICRPQGRAEPVFEAETLIREFDS